MREAVAPRALPRRCAPRSARCAGSRRRRFHATVPLVLLEQGTPRACVYAALVYSLAAITDALDGWLARRQGLVSLLGKFLDPLADKLIVAATLVWLVAMGRIAPWAVSLLIIREITITALRGIASNEGLVISAGEGGKAKTALHGIFYDFGVLDLVHVGRVLVYASLFFSVTSALSYMGLFAEAVEAKKVPPSRGPSPSRDRRA